MVFHYWVHTSLWVTKQIQWERWTAPGTLFLVPLFRYHKSSFWPSSVLAYEKELGRPGCFLGNSLHHFQAIPPISVCPLIEISILRTRTLNLPLKVSCVSPIPPLGWGLQQKKRGTVKAPYSYLDFCPPLGSLWSQTVSFAEGEKRTWDGRVVTSGAPHDWGSP